MDVVLLNITLRHIFFSIFSKIQNEKKKVMAECGKWIKTGKV